MQRRQRLKTVEHLAEQFAACSAREQENVRMKQAYDEDVKQQMEQSERREREMQRKLLEEREKQEIEQKRQEEEIKKVLKCLLIGLSYCVISVDSTRECEKVA